MEPRFGRDLGHVRLHTDATAGASAMEIQALAYTIGNHITFAPGSYAPATLPGKALLAHELTHVLQQEPGEPRTIQRSPAPASTEPIAVRIARIRGQHLAERIRRHGKLLKEVRAKINHDLASLDGAAKDAYVQQVRPALRSVIKTPEIEMPPDSLFKPAVPPSAGSKPPETDAERAHREYEGMLAFYASERESQLASNARAQEQYRRDVPNMTASDIDREWQRGDDTFVAVASAHDNKLKAEQLVRIWMHRWNDRDEAGKAEEKAILQYESARDYDTYIRNLNRFYESDAGRDAMGPRFRKAVDDQAMALVMRKNLYEVSVFLETNADSGKSYTLEDLDKLAISYAQMKAPFEQMGAAMAGMHEPMEPEAFAPTAERIPQPQPALTSTAADDVVADSRTATGPNPSPVRLVPPDPAIEPQPATPPQGTLRAVREDGSFGPPRTKQQSPAAPPVPDPSPSPSSAANSNSTPQQLRATGTADRTPPNPAPPARSKLPERRTLGGPSTSSLQPIRASGDTPPGGAGGTPAEVGKGSVSATGGSGSPPTGGGAPAYGGPGLRRLRPGEPPPRGVPALTRQQARLIGELREGHDVTVPDLKTARALLENMPDVRPHTGVGHDPWETAPSGTYRGDLIDIWEPDAPAVHQSGTAPEAHRRNMHYNIEFPDGTKAAILIVPK